jgi:hypothetical protein
MKTSNILILSCFLFFLFNTNAVAAKGCLQGNCYTGHGTMKYESGNQYTGTFKNGFRDGEGVFIFKNGDKYIGEYKAGKRSGIGIYLFHNGLKYEGEYADDARNGFGIFTMTNGARYEGEYKDGMKHGQGKFIYPDGRSINGTWKFGAFVEPSKAPMGDNDQMTAAYALTVNPWPSDATVKFLDSPLMYAPGMKLMPGRYKLEVSHPKYETKVEYADILENDVVVPVTLRLKSQPVQEERIPKQGNGENDTAQVETPHDSVADNKEKKILFRSLELVKEDATDNSQSEAEQQAGSEEQPQDMEQQRIDAALGENESAQKLSMIEQLKQEIEMLKAASAVSPKLLSLEQLPSSSDNFERVALVIGNSHYPLVGELKNPENDAKDMAEALRKLSFNVTLKLNADQEEMEIAIEEFGERITEESVALFYYAGHGVQMSGQNYLIPIQSRIKKAKDVRYKAVDLNMLIDAMFYAENGKNIIILDACRNNPFPKEKGRKASLGLARTEVPSGTLIAYATGPGSVAIDGEGRNGIYTSYLLANIHTPGIPIEMVFKRVLQGVAADTNRKQIPWMSSSLDIDFYFAVGHSTVAMQ